MRVCTGTANVNHCYGAVLKKSLSLSERGAGADRARDLADLNLNLAIFERAIWQKRRASRAADAGGHIRSHRASALSLSLPTRESFTQHARVSASADGGGDTKLARTVPARDN